MSKKLYKVNLEYTVLLMAENAALAESEAESLVGEDGADTADMVISHEVKELDDIPIEWRDALPFNNYDNETCAQIVEKYDKI